MANSPLCFVPGCGKPVHVKSRGWCKSHYVRWSRHGDPLGGRIPQGEARKFFDNTVLNYEGDDCLVWPYGRDSDGYARLWDEGRAESACRIACAKTHGPPPTSYHEAAHSCGNGHVGCVTPSHLVWKTHTENIAEREEHRKRRSYQQH